MAFLRLVVRPDEIRSLDLRLQCQDLLDLSMDSRSFLLISDNCDLHRCNNHIGFSLRFFSAMKEMNPSFDFELRN